MKIFGEGFSRSPPPPLFSSFRGEGKVYGAPPELPFSPSIRASFEGKPIFHETSGTKIEAGKAADHREDKFVPQLRRACRSKSCLLGISSSLRPQV